MNRGHAPSGPLRLWLVVTLVMTCTTAYGAPGTQPSSDADKSMLVAPMSPQPLVKFELSGWLRSRAQWLHGTSLGNGVGGLPHALSVQRDAASYRSTAADFGLTELRLRLEPRMTLAHHIEVGAQLDVAAGALFGAVDSGPVWLEGDGRDSSWVAARRAWGRLGLFGLATLTMGRVGDHFGLGAWRNDGRDRLNDWQSDVDRVALSAQALGFDLMLARDSMASLPIPTSTAGLSASLQDSADVTRWLIQASAGKLDNEAGLRWSIALSYQDQAVALRIEHDNQALDELDAGCADAGKCVQLVPRDAMIITPQGHVHWRKRTPLGLIDLQAEGLIRFASVDNTDVLVNTDTSKIFIGGALVGDMQITQGHNRWRLRGGWVSGDDAGGFGVRDQSNLTALDPDTKQVVQRDWVTGMSLHRGYLVDGLLYREIVGAVANSWYLRPAFGRQWGAADTGLEIELACLVAGAFLSGSTPGKASSLGIEPELRVSGGLGRWGTLMLNGSLLLPGSALDAGKGGTAASHAWRLSAVWLVDL
ncbi:MAG: hypothetical protein CMH53_10575 [Myxococcales bacterium]|nr:hypothetical protein [Myxococcales bacterium]